MIRSTPLSLSFFSRFTDAIRPERVSNKPPSLNEGLSEEQAREHIAKLLIHSGATERSGNEVSIRVGRSIEREGDYDNTNMERICATIMYLFISRFKDPSTNTESKSHVIQDTVTPVMSCVYHDSNEIALRTLCPPEITLDTLGKI